MPEVVILSPNRFSLYTLTIAELLIREGITIRAIVVRRMINFRRLKQEFTQYPLRFVLKVFNKLVLKEKAYASEPAETIVEFRKSRGFAFKDAEDLGRIKGIPIIYCHTLNDTEVTSRLKEIRPDLVVFTGGGLIRKKILSVSGAGVVNCHMGVLPHYRGMDVIEWAILENNLDQIGITLHFMDEGVDTGPILKIVKIPLRQGENIKRLRNRFEPIMCTEMVSTVIDYLNGNIIPQHQKLDEGRQYFIMHPYLHALARNRIGETTNEVRAEQVNWLN